MSKNGALYKNFKKAVIENDFLNAKLFWNKFVESVSNEHSIPVELKLTVKDLVLIKTEKENAREPRILDHGCGGAYSVCYLLAIGFSKVQGFDVNPSNSAFYQNANKFFKEELLISNETLLQATTDILPYNDNAFDYIFSNQVLEHVPDGLIDRFFAEESRILHPLGRVRHSFPHRNCLFDTHTRTWLLSSILPRSVFNKLVTLIHPHLREMVENGLFLRSPFFYKALALKYFADCIDETGKRLKLAPNLNVYEGNSYLRGLSHIVFRLPIIGPLALSLVAIVAIKDLVFQPVKPL